MPVIQDGIPGIRGPKAKAKKTAILSADEDAEQPEPWNTAGGSIECCNYFANAI